MKLLIWCLPSPVEILATQRTPIISINNSIWINYRHNLENEIISESSSFWSVTYKKFYNTFHHPRRITFSRMNSSAYKNSFFGNSFQTFRIFIFTCNSQVFTSVACQSSCECASMEEVCTVSILLNFTQVIL